MKLEEHSLTPLYRQVMDDIKNAIDQGRYSAGDKIPSEVALSNMYAVSRITVRRAVEELASDGLLTKKQGKGTYVNPPKLKHKIVQERTAQSFQETCVRHGRTPSTRVLGCDRVVATEEQRAFLELREGASLLRLRRLLSADDVPVMLESDYLPYREFSFLTDVDLTTQQLFSVMYERVGRRPMNNGRCLLEIVRATPDVATLLATSFGEPLFSVSADLLDGQGEPLMLSRALVVGSLYAFNVV